MNKQLCFKIDNNELYLDKVLVCFNNTPIFFICCDKNKDYYLALCSDLEELEYIIVKQNIKNIWKMLTQRISMRSAMLDCDSFWLIKSSNTIDNDSVEVLPIEKMDYEILPIEDAVYEKISEEDSLYIDKITYEYLNEVTFGVNEVIKDITEISTNIISSLFDGFNNIVNYVDFGSMIENIEISNKTFFSDDDFRETEKTISYNDSLDSNPSEKLKTGLLIIDSINCESSEIDGKMEFAA